MQGSIACLPRAPCPLARCTWLEWNSFYHVNGSCRAILACKGEINHKDMAVWGEFFCSYHLPMLSHICWTEWQSIWRNQCNGPDSGREQARACEGSWNKMEKSFLGWPLCSLCLTATQKITHAAHWLTVLLSWVACKGRLCVNPSRRGIMVSQGTLPPCKQALRKTTSQCHYMLTIMLFPIVL